MGETRARIKAAAEGRARPGAAWPAIACGVLALAWPLVSAGIAEAGPAGDRMLSPRPSSSLTAREFAQAEKPKLTKPDASPPKQPLPAKQPGADDLLREAIEFQKRGIDEAATGVQDLNERRKALEPPPRQDN